MYISDCIVQRLHSHTQRRRPKHASQQQGTHKYVKEHEDKYVAATEKHTFKGR